MKPILLLILIFWAWSRLQVVLRNMTPIVVENEPLPIDDTNDEPVGGAVSYDSADTPEEDFSSLTAEPVSSFSEEPERASDLSSWVINGIIFSEIIGRRRAGGHFRN